MYLYAWQVVFKYFFLKKISCLLCIYICTCVCVSLCCDIRISMKLQACCCCCAFILVVFLLLTYSLFSPAFKFYKYTNWICVIRIVSSECYRLIVVDMDIYMNSQVIKFMRLCSRSQCTPKSFQKSHMRIEKLLPLVQFIRSTRHLQNIIVRL